MKGLWPLLTIALGACGAIAAAVFAYLSSRRSTSGTVGTTEAATLWAESAKIRQEAVDRARSLQKEVDILRERVHEVEEKNFELTHEIEGLRQEQEDNHRVMTTMRVELDQLRRKLSVITDPLDAKSKEDERGRA